VVHFFKIFLFDYLALWRVFGNFAKFAGVAIAANAAARFLVDFTAHSTVCIY
jgi:hypothetical protein